MNITSCIMVLSHVCNYNCKHCYDRYKSNLLNDMQIYKNACRLLRVLKKMGIHKVMFSGGECTLFPYLSHLITYPKKLGISPSVFTNGSCQNIEIFKDVNMISVSMDGNCELHNNIRGNPFAYKRVIDFLNMEQIKTKNLHVQITINKLNIKDLSFIDDIITRMSFPKDSISVSAMVRTFDEGKNKLLLNQKDYKYIHDYIHKLCEKHSYHIDISTDIMERAFLNTIDVKVINFPLFIDIGRKKFYVFVDTEPFAGDIADLSINSVHEKYLVVLEKFKAGLMSCTAEYVTSSDFLIDKTIGTTV